MPDFFAQRRHFIRKLARARRRFAEPEGDRRRLAGRVGDAHRSRLDLQHAPRCIAQLEYVADVRLDGEILVERADVYALGLEQHAVLAGVGNRTAGGEGGDARALGGADPTAHPVAMEQRRPARGVADRGLVAELIAQRHQPARRLVEDQPLEMAAGERERPVAVVDQRR